jgi:hypothetical protein
MPGNTWIELLTCQKCGRSELVHLSQPEGSAHGMSVDTMPGGFKIAGHELGEAFFCEACDRPATATAPYRGEPFPNAG